MTVSRPRLTLIPSRPIMPILLLDEATSALDEQTEKRLLQNLRRMTDKTVVIVTHRPAALDICDRVIDFSNLLSNIW